MKNLILLIALLLIAINANSQTIQVKGNLAVESILTDTIQSVNGEIFVKDKLSYSTQPDFDNYSLVTKSYVESLIPSGIRYYMTNNPCGIISGCSLTQITLPDSLEVEISKQVTQLDEIIINFVSPEDSFFQRLILGEYNWNVFLSAANNNRLKVYWELVEWNSGQDTVIAQSTYTEFINTTVSRYRIPLYLANDYELQTGSRVVGRIRVYSLSQTTTIQIKILGDYNSHWAIPTNVEVLSQIFQSKGDYMTFSDSIVVDRVSQIENDSQYADSALLHSLNQREIIVLKGDAQSFTHNPSSTSYTSKGLNYCNFPIAIFIDTSLIADEGTDTFVIIGNTITTTTDTEAYIKMRATIDGVNWESNVDTIPIGQIQYKSTLKIYLPKNGITNIDKIEYFIKGADILPNLSGSVGNIYLQRFSKMFQY